MTTPRDDLPPHYHAMRALWTVLQIVLLVVVLLLLAKAVPPGDLIGDAGDWAADLL